MSLGDGIGDVCRLDGTNSAVETTKKAYLDQTRISARTNLSLVSELHAQVGGFVIDGDGDDLVTWTEELELAKAHMERRAAQLPIGIGHDDNVDSWAG